MVEEVWEEEVEVEGVRCEMHRRQMMEMTVRLMALVEEAEKEMK